MARNATGEGFLDQCYASKDVGADVKVDWENVQRAKLRVDPRKWLMSKLAPKKYGDRATLEAAGDGSGALEIIVTKVGDKRD